MVRVESGVKPIGENCRQPRQRLVDHVSPNGASNVRRTASCQPAHLRARVASSIAGSKRRSSRQVAAKPSRSGQTPAWQPGEIGRAERGRLHDHRPVDRRAQDVGQELHGDVARGHAAVDAQHRCRPPPASRRASRRAGRGSGSRPPPAPRGAISAGPELRVSPKIAPRASASQYGAPRPTKAGTR